jgi:purine-nucleoside phosphorylase
MDLGSAQEALRQRTPFVPELAIVLGSGLGGLARCKEACSGVAVDFCDLPGFPRQTVEGHSGRLIFCELENRKVVIQAGRFHYYEGHPMSLVTAPMRLYGRLGVGAVLLTNAAGALNPDLRVGSLMVIKDHINLQGANPLLGPNLGQGPRFPDMSFLYDPGLRRQLIDAGRRRGQELSEGVYVAVTGPSFETPAEIKAFRLLGGDAVGMSTAPEAIVARHEGMSVAGVSCICNLGAGISDKPLAHQEVLDMSEAIGSSFEGVVREFLRDLEI